MEKALNLRLFAISSDHPQWCNSYVSSGQTEGTGFKFCRGPSFSLLPLFFSFLFCLVCLFGLLLFFCFFVFKYILK